MNVFQLSKLNYIYNMAAKVYYKHCGRGVFIYDVEDKRLMFIVKGLNDKILLWNSEAITFTDEYTFCNALLNAEGNIFKPCYEAEPLILDSGIDCVMETLYS